MAGTSFSKYVSKLNLEDENDTQVAALKNMQASLPKIHAVVKSRLRSRGKTTAAEKGKEKFLDAEEDLIKEFMEYAHGRVIELRRKNPEKRKQQGRDSHARSRKCAKNGKKTGQGDDDVDGSSDDEAPPPDAETVD
jgi:hypothetical protein